MSTTQTPARMEPTKGNSGRKSIDPREIGGKPFWEIFARRKHSEPLAHVGSVEAPNLQLAKARAWWIYDQHKWIEMCIAPRDQMITLTEEGKKVQIKVI